MKPFKIGIWIDKNDFPEVGGGFSYTEKLVSGINDKDFQPTIQIYFIGFNLQPIYKKPIINLPYLESFYQTKKVNFFHKFFGLNLERNDIRKIHQDSKAILKDNEIEVIFYPNPFIVIKDFPFLFVNWDIGHKSTHAFPELSMNSEFQLRDKNYSELYNKALFICSESETGKAEISNYFNINPHRIKVLPMFPGRIIEEAVAESVPKFINSDQSFFLYPAQFWPHKNHYNLIIAFSHFIKKEGFRNYKLVLSGSDKGNYSYIRHLIEELGLEAQIIVPGFITNEELKWLYKNTKGLIFPTFLGPTNMPLLEARALGCRVACSNLDGHKELMQENAIYFDPHQPHEICEAMVSLAQTKDRPAPEASSFNRVIEQLETIFHDSIPIRRTWGQKY